MEENKEVTKSVKVNVTTSIDHSLHNLAKQSGLAWNKALEFGISFLLADADGGAGFEYPESNLKNKLEKMIVALNNKCLEAEDLEKRLNGKQTK